jgi:starch phosphorylase
MERMAIISKRTIKMANLCIVASHKVNGVSKLHSDILKNHNFKDFSNIYPDKFMNVTNGIAHRRWLCQSNPALTELLKEKIGEGFYKDAKQLEKFLDYAKDESVLKRLAEIKHTNKVAFAELIKKNQGAIIDPNSRFDVQVKRIHEYKRQLLNVLKIIHLYGELKANPDMDFTPQTFIIGGKAAPTYYMAKRIIKLINQLSAEIEKDPIISKKLKVLFIENYTVTIAESLMPAAEVSEQISLAGKEASGTGNMKFMINGALTLGTLDGANVEIREECGDENIFIFGMTADEVSKAWKLGYEPKNYYESNSNIRRVIDMLIAGFNGESFRDIADYLLFSGNVPDPYMCLADFDSYIAAHTKMDEIYKDQKKWNKMSLMNIGSAGFFAADRSIEKYAKEIWNLTKHGK